MQGWRYKPVKFSFETTDGQRADTEYCLSTNGREDRVFKDDSIEAQTDHRLGFNWVQNDWMEIEVGEFTVGAGDNLVGLKFSMSETGGHWKGGLYLDCAMIHPTFRGETFTAGRNEEQVVGSEHTSSRMANISADNVSSQSRTLLETGLELMMQSTSVKHYISYLLTRNLDDIQQAVHCAREVLDLVPRDIPLMPIILYNLARPLLRRFQHTRQGEDITEAIKMFQNAIQLLTDDNPLRIMRQKCFGYLSISYLERDGNLDGFLELNAPDVYSPSTISLDTLSHNLCEDDEVFKYFLITSPPIVHDTKLNLDFAIQVSRQVLEFFSSDPAKSATILHMMGGYLLVRFQQQNKLEDLNKAVDCCCGGLELLLPKQQNKLEDLNKAVDCCRGGPELLLPNSSAFPYRLTLASSACRFRFDVLGKREDIEDAVRYSKQAMEVVDSQDPLLRTICLHDLALAMTSRYDVVGDVNSLDAAIDASSRAIDTAERNDHFHREGLNSVLLNTLAFALALRALRSGQAEDMSEAIATSQKAVDLTPPKDRRSLVRRLSSLCQYEVLQYSKLQDVEYLQRSFRHDHQARSIQIHIREEGHACKEDYGLELSLATGGAFIMSLFADLSLDVGCLDTAIDTAREGIARGNTHHAPIEAPLEAPLEYGQHTSSHHVLCCCLLKRWRRTHEKKDLDEGISIARGMIKLAEATKHGSVVARKHLGEFLFARYKSTGDDEYREEALAVLLEAFWMSGGTLISRIWVGHLLVDILSDLADWDRARKFSRETLDLLVIVNGRSLGWQDKQYWLRGFSIRAATYASIALEAGSDVLDVIDILETCRGSILGHLIDNRTDLDDLTKAAPEKAELFRTLRDEINTMIDPSGDSNTRVKQTTRRIEADGEIRACLEEIRTLEGFQRFMLGPTQRELKVAAARGPILIVNVTLIRSDAIIITKDASVLLPLPKLKYQKVEEYLDADLTNFSLEDIGRKNKKYRQLQEWLWDNCVKLIFEKLDDLASGPAKLHVWWIGTGIANSLPFHAAGIYTGNGSETTLSRAISSYTPTLKVLTYGRRQQKLKDESHELDMQGLTSKPQILQLKPRLAIITMPSTPGRDDLEGVQREAEAIQEIVRDIYSTQILFQPSAKDTMARMVECEIVHFACHGESQDLWDASNSHLLLQAKTLDYTMPAIDELKLRDVAATDLSHGKLAFLSACSTAKNSSKLLGDEVLHLASGFHVAGYLHAIGNLWPSDDEVSVQLVKGFYKHLVAAGELGDGDNIAKALNEALIDVTKKYARQPLCWAQFVHFGV